MKFTHFKTFRGSMTKWLDSLMTGVAQVGALALTLLIGSSVVMAFYVAFAAMFELIFKVKLL